MHEPVAATLQACLWLTDAIAQTRHLADIYEAALEALHRGLGVSRSSILLFDPDGVMRFKASRGISDSYRRAVEGHTPWSPETVDPQPIVIPDVTAAAGLAELQHVLRDERIAALAFFPLVSHRQVIGKFMLYYGEPHQLTDGDRAFARLVASQVAFAVERMRALEDAHEGNRLKDEFLAMLSHELRTPLNAIVGWLRLLQSGTLDAARASEALAVIDRNASLQVQLIEQMLDVSRIIAGKLQIDRVPMLLTQLIEQSLEAIQPAAFASGVTLISHVPPSLPLIEGDPERLQQILNNLLSNAIKFTPAGGEVQLRCVASDGAVQIEVQDSGIGITPEFLPLVFDRFRQADASTTRPHGGLGLGLNIARHLAELHGGTICASSPGRGRGATFTLTLPVPRFVASPRGAAGQRSVVAARATGALEGARVLVVDDEPDARELLRVLFTGHGSIVGEASSTAEALECLDRDNFDLLIADLAMPAADGYALIQTLRQRGADLAAIAVTAFARPQDRARALQAGFDAFHAKPFDPSALLRDASGLRRRDYTPRI